MILTPYTVCEAIRAVVLAALDADPDSAEVTTTYTGVGLVAWDDCCGQLVVTPERTFRYTSFPQEATTDEQCFGGELGLTILVTLVRCVPTPDDMGNPPTAAQLQSAHERVLEDGAIVWNTIVGPLPDDEWERANVSQDHVGGEGGCIAITTRLTVGLGTDRWCWE